MSARSFRCSTSHAFGRGYLDLELCFALFTAAAGVALWVDRPERPQRSIAELLAGGGVVLAAAAVLVVPGAAGHAAQTAPRGLSLFLDWAHLLTGSLWIGGLVGVLVLWRAFAASVRTAGLAVVVPRFSNVALLSVIGLIASGTGATIVHMPTVASLWQTSYGQAILVKIGLLLAALVLAAVNLLFTKQRLGASQPEVAAGAARLLRRLIAGEALLVAAAIVAAAVLSSLPPPSKALAEVGGASAHVGPGTVVSVVKRNGYELRFRVAPNKAAVPNAFSVEITRNGKPVRNAGVLLTFEMLDMAMPNQEFHLSETKPGVYGDEKPALVMVGHWGLSFAVNPPGGTPFNVLLVDHTTG